MSKNIYPFVTLLYLLVTCICSEIISASGIHKFSRFDSLTGRQCRADSIIFDAKNVVSITECLQFCSRQTSCTGISYRESTEECIGCKEKLYISNITDAFETSLFYRLNECPDENGIIQFDINFRLKFYKTEKNQGDAERDCKHKPNGHLVVLDEEWKINAIENTLTTCAGYNSTFYWIDGTRLNISSEWKFTDGRNIPMSNTTFWHSNNPNSRNMGRTCLLLKYRVLEGYRLNDKGCNIQNPFICEF